MKLSKCTARCRRRQPQIIHRGWCNNNNFRYLIHLHQNTWIRRFIGNSQILNRLTIWSLSKRIFTSKSCNSKGHQGQPRIMLLLARTHKSHHPICKQTMHKVRCHTIITTTRRQLWTISQWHRHSTISRSWTIDRWAIDLSPWARYMRRRGIRCGSIYSISASNRKTWWCRRDLRQRGWVRRKTSKREKGSKIGWLSRRKSTMSGPNNWREIG